MGLFSWVKEYINGIRRGIDYVLSSRHHKKGNYVEAARWLRHGARLGSRAAMHDLASYYLAGIGVKKSEISAAHLLMEAANHGYAPAQSTLAALHETGAGVEKDFLRALVLYNQAFVKDDPRAQLVYAEIYETGQFHDIPPAGIKINIADAFRLYMKVLLTPSHMRPLMAEEADAMDARAIAGIKRVLADAVDINVNPGDKEQTIITFKDATRYLAPCEAAAFRLLAVGQDTKIEKTPTEIILSPSDDEEYFLPLGKVLAPPKNPVAAPI